MAKIKGLENIRPDQINYELQHGGKFVIFQYAISLVVFTTRQSSSIYFIRAGESTFMKHIGFTFLTLFLGWWGIPWGPIYSIGAIATNFGGGKDVTADVLAQINQAAESEEQYEEENELVGERARAY
ncbi:MAG: hypothetical protein JXR53_11550 [Bacteroidales bacterium]|nr:hypothetical protein [Bacteroidales bacterium]